MCACSLPPGHAISCIAPFSTSSLVWPWTRHVEGMRVWGGLESLLLDDPRVDSPLESCMTMKLKPPLHIMRNLWRKIENTNMNVCVQTTCRRMDWCVYTELLMWVNASTIYTKHEQWNEHVFLTSVVHFRFPIRKLLIVFSFMGCNS